MTKRICLALAVWMLLALSPVAGAAPPRPFGRAVTSPAGNQTHGSQEYEFANCRFGVAASTSDLQRLSVVSKLNVGWVLDFSANILPDRTPEYTPLVRISQDRGGSTSCDTTWGYEINPPLTENDLGQRIDSMPGARWLIGNEPERVGQDGVCPREYARAYHDVYEFIKNRDPKAQVFAGGIVEPTAMRMAYLDLVWGAYEAAYGEPMPADGWAVHLYVLSETGEGDASIALGTDPDLGMPYSGKCSDPNTWCHAEHDDIDLLSELLVRMREWLKNHGYQDRPLLITEFGVLKPYNLAPGTCSLTTCSGSGNGCFCDEQGETFHPQRVADFVARAFDLLLTAADPDLGYPADNYRLVQQWLWFRLAMPNPHSLGHAADLADPESTGPDGEWNLTVVGQRWQGYVRQISPELNLFVAEVPTVTGTVPSGTCSGAVTLGAHMMNNGNVSSDEPASATFFADESLTIPIGTATFEPPRGCAQEKVVVTVPWEGLCAGTHQFWVTVDGGASLSMAGDDEGVAAGIVIIEPISHVYLPAVLR